MKFILLLTLAIVSNSLLSAPPEAMFSPYEGEEAFERIYDTVEKAKKTAHLTIYSWSDSGIDKAMESVLTDNPGVKLRVVLHRPLAKKSSTLSKVTKLEKLGAMFKMAKMNMHEKFILVDNKNLVNSSANMSGGAKTKYAEDFIFINSDGEKDNEKLIATFEREFAILWNSAEDIISHGEKQKADILPLEMNKKNLAAEDDSMTLFSSSMNFNLEATKIGTTDYKRGQVLTLKERKLRNGEGAFVVSSAMIRAIDNAKDSVYMSLNHFNLYSVSEALIRASIRGVEIRLAVDNQEFKTRIRDEGRRSIEMTPRFVRDWKKLPGNRDKEAPVRIKYYSLAPHHSSWFLNHHKYMIIDVHGKSPSLFAGSFNISQNAEFNQFDNLVEFKGERYRSLIQAYTDNHSRIWTMNRDRNDRPKKSALDEFKKVYEGTYVRIHAANPEDSISLTWSEAIDLQDEIKKIAPGIYRGLYQKSGCFYYDFKKKNFFGGCK